MKLLVVSQYYKPEPVSVSGVAEELVRRGHRVTVLTSVPNYPEGTVPDEYRNGRHRDEILDGVRVVRVPTISRGRNLRGFNKVRRIGNYLSFPVMSLLAGGTLEGDYDCVLCFQFSPVLMALPALRIARQSGIPCILWSFDLWPEDMLSGGMSRGGLPFRVMGFVSKKIYGAADMVAVTSPGFVEYFSERLGLKELRTSWLPQFAEDVFDLPSEGKVESGDAKAVFTFAGNVGGNQAVETIVRAASLVRNHGIHIWIAGSGSHLDECKRLAVECAAENVEFLGRLPLETMPALYASSDALILTLAKSHGGSLVPVYTIPRKFQSYIAAGKPVLCSAEGTVSEIVESEGCGIACPAEDANRLAEAMDRFVEMPMDQREMMSAAARRLYDRQFSRERFFNDLESLLIELAGGK
ncbi:glycosyltransferase family 4 protein [Collinsella tanakaei]|nr:glycosyltransferase family 4 protein [Collinsella tanakaei]